jgi:hypothetical protein
MSGSPEVPALTSRIVTDAAFKRPVGSIDRVDGVQDG